MKRLYRPAPFVLMLTSVIGLLTPAPASALQSWTVKVLHVNDGDTFEVDTNGDRVRDYTVRMIGLNAAEGHWDHKRWVGKCQSKMAHDRLEDLVEGKRVVLKATSFASTGYQRRKIRFVHRLSDGKDLSELMLREGRAVPYPNNDEPARNARYIKAARAAAAEKRGIWNNKACGWGPSQSAKLKVKVRWLIGARNNLNSEYARIENDGDTAVSLKNWILRDSSTPDYYYFKDTATVAAHGSVTIHSGYGTARGSTHKHYYWKRSEPVFAWERVGLTSGDRTGKPILGDGAYLYDPHRDIRAYMNYPCIGTCTDPIGQSLDVHVNYEGGGPDATNAEINQEEVVITNTSLANVDLSSYMLETWPTNYEITRYPATILAPGEQLVVHSGKDPGGMTTRLNQYWGSDKALFNSEDYVELRRMTGEVAVKHVYP